MGAQGTLADERGLRDRSATACREILGTPAVLLLDAAPVKSAPQQNRGVGFAIAGFCRGGGSEQRRTGERGPRPRQKSFPAWAARCSAGGGLRVESAEPRRALRLFHLRAAAAPGIAVSHGGRTV